MKFFCFCLWPHIQEFSPPPSNLEACPGSSGLFLSCNCGRPRPKQRLHLTELQNNLDRMCYQLAAPSQQLGLHVTNMTLQSVSFMTKQLMALNGLMRNDSAKMTHERIAE